MREPSRLRTYSIAISSSYVAGIAFYIAVASQSGTGLAANESAVFNRDSITSVHRVFDPTSFWYIPIRANAPIHSNSAGLLTEFLRQLKTFYGHAAINASAYSSPIYVVDADTKTVPVVQVDCHTPSYHNAGLDEMWQAVPIPPHAKPAQGTDAEMTIYQPSTDRMWEFWKARKNEVGEWQACWGGRMLSVSKNMGIWAHPYGTTATGLPFIGGQITIDELRRGRVDHVMGIALVEAENWDVFSWPANRSDGYNPMHVPNRIPEGLRMRLDPDLNVQAMQIHPVAKIIAEAAQRYGFVVWDKAGAISLRAENSIAYTSAGMPDPYPLLWNGTPSYEVLAGFPWDRLQFLPMNYGRP